MLAQVHAGFQEMSPSFVMFLTGQSSAMYSPAWPRPDELATDRQLPEATRWLSRRVHLQPMAMELPVEVRLLLRQALWGSLTASLAKIHTSVG